MTTPTAESVEEVDLVASGIKADSVATAVSTVPAAPVERGGKSVSGKSSRRKCSSPVPDALTAAALAQAAQLVSGWGFHGVATLLHAQLQPNNRQQAAAAAAAAAAAVDAGGGSSSAAAVGGGTSAGTHPAMLPTVAQVQTAAAKAVLETPPWIHWSKIDMAPQLRVTDKHRLQVSGPLRGYRMARATTGVTKGCYYFECRILPGPTAKEIVANLPPNARLGPGLQDLLERALKWEEAQEESPQKDDPPGRGRKRKLGQDGNIESSLSKPPEVGGHLRIGWSMRTGDLQAPVGYDKWSYGIRCSTGSIIHQSRRQDDWGEGMVAGDVLGCAICLYSDGEDTAPSKTPAKPAVEGNSPAKTATENHIRFFKNGQSMGDFVITKGKRAGGEAFVGLENGTYYPAASCYMGGAVKVNFGPHWIYPPRKLPTGFKLSPMNELSPPPLSPAEATAKVTAATKLFRKTDQQRALKEAVVAEAEILCRAHEDFMRKHLEEIRQERQDRGMSTQDLPETDASAPSDTASTTEQAS